MVALTIEHYVLKNMWVTMEIPILKQGTATPCAGV